MSIEEMEERWNICNKCPICDHESGVCNGNLYLNPDNNDVSVIPKKGYIKGCSCILDMKIPNPKKHCPAKKW